MSNRGQNLPFTPFHPLAWFLIGSFAFVLSFRALSFPLFTSLKRCLPFASYLHGIFILRGFFVLSNTFYIGGYLLTTEQIYGFFAALPTVCSLSHINGKTPALFSGAFACYLLTSTTASGYSLQAAKYFSNHGTKFLYVPQPLGLLNCS